MRRGRIKEYVDEYPGAVYTPFDPAADTNPQWDIKADCAFPCATQNEINGKDAANLLRNGVNLVAEGANMPTHLEGVRAVPRRRHPLRPRQGRQRRRGGHLRPRDDPEQHAALLAARRGGRPPAPDHEEHPPGLRGRRRGLRHPGQLRERANIAGFLKVANAMMDQGVV